MLGSLILYFKGMRRMMFQLSGFYCNIPQEFSLHDCGYYIGVLSGVNPKLYTQGLYICGALGALFGFSICRFLWFLNCCIGLILCFTCTWRFMGLRLSL